MSVCYFANLSATDLVPFLPESMAGSGLEWQIYQQIQKNEEEKAKEISGRAMTEQESVRQAAVTAQNKAKEAETKMKEAQKEQAKLEEKLKAEGLSQEEIENNEEYQALTNAYNTSLSNYNLNSQKADSLAEAYMEMRRKQYEEQKRLEEARTDYEKILAYIDELDTYAYDKSSQSFIELRDELEKMKSAYDNYSRFMYEYASSNQEGFIPESLQIEYENYKEKIASVNSRLKEINPKKDIGDPVFIATGQYYLEDVDVSFQYGISTFDLVRTFFSGCPCKGVLGNGWQCSLDTCIVRGTEIDVLKDYTDVLDVMTDIKNIISKLVDYEYEAVAADGLKKECQTQIQILSERRRFLLNIMNDTQNNERLNLYANNEYVSLVQNLSNNVILYVTDYGSYELFLFNESKNVYVPLNEDSSAVDYIGLTEGEKSFFVVHESDGEIKKFDEYGKPVCFENVYGSKIEFLYDDKSGQLSSINHNSKKILVFKWNNKGLLSSVKNLRNGEEVFYEYTNGYLTSIRDVNGDERKFAYDHDGDIIEIIKADGSKSCIQYGRSGKENYKHVVFTQNEEGFSEIFSFSKTEGKIIYSDADGQEYVYIIKNGNQIVEEYLNGQCIISRVYDEEGRVISYTDNYETKHYVYDDFGNICLIQYNDGSFEEFSYDGPYSKITLFKDRDGVETRFDYNNMGTCVAIYVGNVLVSRIAVNDWGGIISSLSKGFEQTYEYNDVYQITKKGNALYEYDNKGNVSKVIDEFGLEWNYEYSLDEKTLSMINPRGLKIIIVKNNRDDIVKIIEQDSKYGSTCVRLFDYDRRHCLLNVWCGFGPNELEAEKSIQRKESFEYSAAGRLVSYTRWNYGPACVNDAPGIKNEYVYGNGDEVLSFNRHFVDYGGNALSEGQVWSYESTYKDGLKEVSFFNSEMFICTGFWDSNGNLVKTVDADNHVREEKFSSAGRLLTKENVHGGILSYVYNQITGLLDSVCDNQNVLEKFCYDETGLVSQIYFADGYTQSFKQNNKPSLYDFSNNSLINENFDYPVYYDSWGNLIRSDDMGLQTLYNADGQRLFVKTYDLSGNEKIIYYSYNAFGKIAQKSDSYGNETNYCYDENGNIIKIVEGNVVTWQGKYDCYGNLIWEKGCLVPEKEYVYDALGNVICVIQNGRVIFSRENSFDMRSSIIYDAEGNKSLYEFDDYGNVIKEIDALGNIQTFSYNNLDNSVYLRDKNGYEKYVSYNRKTGCFTTLFSSGKKHVINIDENGNITKAIDDVSNLEYVYDSEGRLEKSLNNGIPVLYFYNSKGFLSEININGVSTFYEYDEIGRVRSICSGENKRTYFYFPSENKKICVDSDGTKTVFEYDAKGRLSFVFVRNNLDILLSGEGFVYDDQNHCTSKINFSENRLCVESYTFDKDNRLSSVRTTNAKPYFEYTRELLVGSEEKIDDFFLSNTYEQIDSGVIEILQNLGFHSFDVYYEWEESYNYDYNGNLILKLTPVGEFSYTYNALNQLQSLDFNGKNIINFLYDANGNLIQKKLLYKTEIFTYNESNRISEYQSTDMMSGESSSIAYTYDCLGRLVCETNGEKTVSLIYDGLSFDVIAEFVEIANSNNVRYRKISSTYTGNYVKYLSRLDGELIFEQTTDGKAFSFVTDQKGTICSAVDCNDGSVSSMQYHVNGFPFQENEFAYCGKRFDSLSQLYDYGFRHYSPQLSVFTSEDPSRDGLNWYSYCDGNPVDYEDFVGLKNIKRRNTKLMQDYDSEKAASLGADKGNYRYCMPLGNHVSSYFRSNGCYLNFTTDVINTFANMNYDMTYFNTYENFGTAQSKRDELNWDTMVARYGIGYDTYADEKKNNPDVIKTVSDYINMHDAEARDCILAVQVHYYKDDGLHWVTVVGGVVEIEKKSYVQIQATSNQDLYTNTPNHTERVANGWIVVDQNVYVPVEKIEQARTFYKQK